METAFGHPAPETWRVFRLKVEKQDQSGSFEVTLLRPADWLVEQQQSTALLALLAELQDAQAVDQPPSASAPFGLIPEQFFRVFRGSISFPVHLPAELLAAAPSAGRFGTLGLFPDALNAARESLELEWSQQNSSWWHS